MTDIVQLMSADEKSLSEINMLLQQLSERVPPCSLALLAEIVKNPYAELWVAKESETIVGMGELAIVLKPEGVIAQIEDVVVDEKFRGKGLGRLLSEKLVERARARAARVVQLSSRADRAAANALYKKLGFTLHETNLYYLNL